MSNRVRKVILIGVVMCMRARALVAIRAANVAILGYGPSVMATPVGPIGSSSSSLPDLRRHPGRSFFYTGPLDSVVTKAALSDSVPATTVAAGNVTLPLALKWSTVDLNI